MSAEAKKYLEENYSNHNSWGLYPLSEDEVAELMQSYAREYHKQQMQEKLEEVEKNIFNKSADLANSSQFASNHKYDYRSVQEGAEKCAKWLLNHLKETNTGS